VLGYLDRVIKIYQSRSKKIISQILGSSKKFLEAQKNSWKLKKILGSSMGP
jgi:hypothetical protein